MTAWKMPKTVAMRSDSPQVARPRAIPEEIATATASVATASAITSTVPSASAIGALLDARQSSASSTASTLSAPRITAAASEIAWDRMWSA